MKRDERMEPLERVLATLKHQETDRIPVINPVSVATVESMKECGCYFPKVHTSPERMARLAATGHELLGFDSIAPYFSVQQEAAALGCQVNWGQLDEMPDVREVLYQEADDIVIPATFLEHRAITTVIDALRMLKKTYKERVCLIGKVMGPWTLAYHLFGVEPFLMDTIQDPGKVEKILSTLKEVSILFAKAQIEAGAHLITVADHATGDLISPKDYVRFLKPIHQEMAKKIPGPIILHICGQTLDRMKDIAETGFKVFHFESRNRPEEAKREVGDRILLAGNINNPEVLYRGRPADVRREVLIALEAGVEMIAPECAVPLMTPNENLRAIVETVKDFCKG